MTEPQASNPDEPSPTSVATGGRIALYTSIDQVLSSLGNALLLFTVAQTASLAQFGLAAMLVAVAAVWMAFNRGALGAPLLLASNLDRHDIRIEAGYAIVWAALTSLGAAASLCVVGALAGDLSITLVFAIWLPAAMIQDTLRFTAISRGQPKLAVAADGLWTCAIGLAFLANMVRPTVQPVPALTVWGCGALLTAVLLAVTTGTRPRTHRILDWWRTYGRSRVHFGIGDASFPAYTAAVLVAVTAIVDSAVAGSLRGATTLFGPIALMFAALPLIFVPHARRARKSPDEQWRLMVKVSWLSTALTVLATVVFVSIPNELGVLILGSTWQSAVRVMPFEGLAVMAAIWMASTYIFFQAQGKSRTAFWTRMLQLFAQLTGCVIAAFAVGSAVSIAAAGAAACWLTVAVSVVLARRAAAHSAIDATHPHDDVPACAADSRALDAPWPVIDVLEAETSGSAAALRGDRSA